MASPYVSLRRTAASKGASPCQTRHRHNRTSRLARAAALSGVRAEKSVQREGATQLLEAIVEPGDRVAIEGDNQKQADFLAAALAKVDPARVHDLHMVQSVMALPEHLAVFERGIANRLDFAFAGPQSRKLAELVASKARQDRRDPHLSRTLRPHAGGPDAAGRARRRRQGRPQWQPLHRSEHRGHADHRRSRGIPRRHRRGAGQRDRRSPAPRRHSLRLGRFRGAEPKALSDRSALHARSRQDQERERADGDDGDRRGLRTLPGAAAQPRHRLCHGGDRTDPADLRRPARIEGQGRHGISCSTRIRP